MRKHLLLPLGLLLASPAMAGEMLIDVQIPRLEVAEYHRPYVAIWLERANQQPVADLAVWYDVKMKDKEGEKWLKDLRQWWRRSGRNLDMPVDGVSGATRAVGTHRLSVAADDPRLSSLEAGEYRLVVEAAREVGGRELLRVPFSWPVSRASQQQAQGKTELGTITLTLNP